MVAFQGVDTLAGEDVPDLDSFIVAASGDEVCVVDHLANRIDVLARRRKRRLLLKEELLLIAEFVIVQGNDIGLQTGGANHKNRVVHDRVADVQGGILVEQYLHLV